ncbi:MAG: DUF2807 domain-containing protein [Muribaculaceae bacterium]|nr:DUF2807 domain-containing protein [Muribaculaceae bacterium]MDE6753480.1 DUF2807 domain-containing protein [Muribaculaceae bacterium]
MHIFRFLNKTFLQVIATVAISLTTGAGTIAAFAASAPEEAPMSSPAQAQESIKFLKREIPEFSSLSVYAEVTLILVYGKYPGYIEVEDKGTKNFPIMTDWTDGKLTFYEKIKKNLVVRIYSENINSITMASGSLEVENGLWGKDITLVGMSNSTMNINNITATKISIQLYNNASANINDIKGVDINPTTYNNSNITLKKIDADKVTARAYNVSQIKLTGRCRKKSISMTDNGKVTYSGLIEDSNKTFDPQLFESESPKQTKTSSSLNPSSPDSSWKGGENQVIIIDTGSSSKKKEKKNNKKERKNEGSPVNVP